MSKRTTATPPRSKSTLNDAELTRSFASAFDLCLCLPLPRQHDSKQLHRNGNVFQFRWREFFKARLDRIANLAFHIHRNANPACARQWFDARSDVDSVAVNIAAAMHHVANMNADL